MQEKKNRDIEPCFDFLNEFSGTFPWQNSRIFNRKINVRFSCGYRFSLSSSYEKRRCYSFTQQSLPYPSLSRLPVPLRRYPSSCRPRRRRKGRGSRKAGETAGLPRGCESGQERSDAERGGGTPPADWGQQARSALLPLAGASLCSVGEHKREARHTPLAGSLFDYRRVRCPGATERILR